MNNTSTHPKLLFKRAFPVILVFVIFCFRDSHCQLGPTCCTCPPLIVQENSFPWPCNGFIGIGTTAPITALEVGDFYNDPTITLSSFHKTPAVDFCQLSLEWGTTTPLHSQISKKMDMVLRTQQGTSNIVITAQNDTGSIKFGTGPSISSSPMDTLRAIITHAGRFGVGTSLSNPICLADFADTGRSTVRVGGLYSAYDKVVGEYAFSTRDTVKFSGVKSWSMAFRKDTLGGLFPGNIVFSYDTIMNGGHTTWVMGMHQDSSTVFNGHVGIETNDARGADLIVKGSRIVFGGDTVQGTYSSLSEALELQSSNACFVGLQADNKHAQLFVSVDSTFGASVSSPEVPLIFNVGPYANFPHGDARIDTLGNFNVGGISQAARVFVRGADMDSGAGAFQVVDSSSSTLLYVRNNGQVGVGTKYPIYQLQLTQDSAAKPLTGSWTVYSDARLKKNITPFDEGLSVIDRIDPVRYEYNGLAGLPTGKTGIGVIAQEIQKVAPYTVSTSKSKLKSDDAQATDLLTFNASALTFVAINAIKELHEKVKELQVLNGQLDSIKQRLSNLEEVLGSLHITGVSGSTGALQPSVGQNEPNPFSASTSIEYHLPLETHSASLTMFSANGDIV